MTDTERLRIKKQECLLKDALQVIAEVVEKISNEGVITSDDRLYNLMRNIASYHNVNTPTEYHRGGHSFLFIGGPLHGQRRAVRFELSITDSGEPMRVPPRSIEINVPTRLPLPSDYNLSDEKNKTIKVAVAQYESLCLAGEGGHSVFVYRHSEDTSVNNAIDYLAYGIKGMFG